MLKCSICGKPISHPLIPNYIGNNPYPVRTGEKDRCCDDCNNEFVITLRIQMLGLPHEKTEELADRLNTTPCETLRRIMSISF